MEAQYRLLAELEAKFDYLIEHTEALLDVYSSRPRDIWVLDQQSIKGDWLRRALLDFWYQDGQDGRATRSYIALVAADDGLLEAVSKTNAAKSDLAYTLAEIRQQAAELIPEIKAVLPFRHPALHNHLRGKGLARLHLKQCWRHLPIADAPLSRVRLAWYTSGRSIKRLTVREAERKLLDLNSEAAHIRIQLKRLASIPDSEPLAQVQQQAPVMRANLFFQEPLDDGRSRRAMNLPLPLFIPTSDGRLPNHNLPDTQPPVGRTRAKRSDERLEDEVFLPSIRVYRYK